MVPQRVETSKGGQNKGFKPAGRLVLNVYCLKSVGRRNSSTGAFQSQNFDFRQGASRKSVIDELFKLVYV